MIDLGIGNAVKWPIRGIAVVVWALWAVGFSWPVAAQPAGGVPLMKPPIQPPASAASAASGAAGVRTIGWSDLTPADWDPFREFRQLDLMAYQDGDPRLQPLIRKMREIWDNAPVNPAVVGQAVRLPGYVVPLEESRAGVSEFLLVPYFGACIHSPPPPANQIVHVRLRTPSRQTRSMDTVWVSGTLATVKSETYMGAASWRMEEASVAPYSDRPSGR